MNVLFCIYRAVFRCGRRFCPSPQRPKLKIDVPVTHIPWLWIGAKYDDHIETVTDLVNQCIDYGLRLTPDMLAEITGHFPETWKYVDAKTLEERIFPSDGIVIQKDEGFHYIHDSAQ